MEFATDIKTLVNEDLPKYKNFLLDQIWEKDKSEKFRGKILDRVDMVREEIKGRDSDK